MRITLVTLFLGYFCFNTWGQVPKILTNKKTIKSTYLPDFSYAGYQNGHVQDIEFIPDHVLEVATFGAISNDGLDDSKALIACINKANELTGKVKIQFQAGRYILSDILYLRRNDLMLSGAGSGENGTVLYYPRPMMYLPDPEPLRELREYLVELDKRQREKQNNIDLAFSQYAWSGGFIWTGVEGERVKSYLEKYNKPSVELANVTSGKKGELSITVSDVTKLKKGDVVQLEWYNKEGKEGSLIKELYNGADIKIGSHHWNYPNMPIVKQQLRISEIKGTKVILQAPLLLDIEPQWKCKITEWKHIERVGIDGFRIEFPYSARVAHHVEPGYNAIYLTRLFDGWVNDVKIKNADSGILSEESANLTVSNIETFGETYAHYTVQQGGVHNMLVKNFKVSNKAVHPLSFNTFATKSVYKDCEVLKDPILDQHSGANHQNLFDNIKVHISLNGRDSYPLFAGGGAGYWKPSHGAYSTFWNINAQFLDGKDTKGKILLNGMKDGPKARVVGVNANLPLKVEYGPDAYIEKVGENMGEVPSLYDYQLKKRCFK